MRVVEPVETTPDVSEHPEAPPPRWAGRAPPGGARGAPEAAGLQLCRQCPDQRDVEGDDDHRPERVVRQEEEVRQRRQHREGDAGDHRPGLAHEQRDADGHGDEPDGEVCPAPRGQVELERVVRCVHEELVVEQRGQSGHALEQTDGHEHGGREDGHSIGERALRGVLEGTLRGGRHRGTLLSGGTFPDAPTVTPARGWSFTRSGPRAAGPVRRPSSRQETRWHGRGAVTWATRTRWSSFARS